MINRFATRDENFRLYKAMAVHQWAQTWFGTWRLDLAQLSENLPRKEKSIRLFHALETLRLDACIGRELPGMYRDMQTLRRRLDRQVLPLNWAGLNERLQSKDAQAYDSWALVVEVLNGPVPPPCCYQGLLYPARVREISEVRRKREKKALRIALAKLSEQRHQDHEKDSLPAVEKFQDQATGRKFSLKRVAANDLPDGFTYELLFEDKPADPPEEVRGLMTSIIQDLGEIPEDYLVPAGPAAYDPATLCPETDPDQVWKGTYHEEGALLYNEWDHARRHYRKNWCVLREREVQPQYNDFVDQTLHKYGGLRKSLRRTFEVLRGEDRLLKKQPHGDDIDIDALVEAYADVTSGREMSSRVFTKMHKVERNIAVMLMVDMSGSTKGWINDAERESLVLLCEVLETLGDRYAIYGFSGMTRKRCELFRIKRFDEPYDAQVRARISGILPQDYTRMGVAIRHLTKLLNEVEARTKLLLTLSDGKPDDYTGYRGEYGIEDTRQALLEARRDGIHPFCITIDDLAGDYLPHMYGAVNYVVIDHVKKLPLKVSDIYRRLTT